ncbi:MAG: hypothetical protein ABMA15_14865 [Vicinamibacterales bacterium]
MTPRVKARSPFIGVWRIIDMELWDREDLALLGPPHLTLDRRGQGSMRFLAIEAGVDYRPGELDGLPAIEFSFDGNDEGDRISGRGWAVFVEHTLRGRVFFHGGDESGFSATRHTARRPTTRRS